VFRQNAKMLEQFHTGLGRLRRADCVWNCPASASHMRDCEGFEAHVLLGASELLHSRKAPFIAFEFCDWAEDRAFPGRKGWAQQILLDAGYKLSRLVEGAQEPIALAAPIAEGCHTIIGSKP
jgi:hypothetical protein